MTGIPAALKNNSGPGIESKGLKAHFYMGESGLISITHAEAVFEQLVNGTGNDTKEDEQSTLSKLGSTISKLFSGN